MEISEWIYVAPHRIRAAPLNWPRCETWKEHEALNTQRLARVFEFRGCVAFVGSGASACLGYPRWGELLADPPSSQLETDLKWLVEKGKVDPTQALQILGCSEQTREALIQKLSEEFASVAGSRSSAPDAHSQPSPFDALVDLPIRRFVTTNYDEEIEKALGEKLGARDWNTEKSFAQNETSKLSLFSVALASKNRNMVFHCHGTFAAEAEKISQEKNNKIKATNSRLVLTDADYNYWYLAKDTVVSDLQEYLDIILDSSPVFFVGYSLADADMLRLVRRASLRKQTERAASNLFLLLNKRDLWSDLQVQHNQSSDTSRIEDAWSLAKQIKLGVNFLSFDTDQTTDKKKVTLAAELTRRKRECWNSREDWRLQPRVKALSSGPTGMIAARNSSTNNARCDSLFDPRNLESGQTLFPQLSKALEEDFAVAVTSPAATGKFLKACQFVQWLTSSGTQSRRYKPLVFHAYNNEDIYSYSRRMWEVVLDAIELPSSYEPLMNKRADRIRRQRLLVEAKQPITKNDETLLVVINNIDLLLGIRDDGPFNYRHKVARDFLNWLLRWNYTLSKKVDMRKIRIRFLLTSRFLPLVETTKTASDSSTVFRQGSDDGRAASTNSTESGSLNLANGNKKKGGFRPIRQFSLPPFLPAEIGLEGPRGEGEYKKLAWELQGEYSALILAASFVTDFKASPVTASADDERNKRLEGLLEALRSNSSELGTRVVRHVVRELDKAEMKGGKCYETLLSFLCCFNTPVALLVFNEAAACSQNYLKGDFANSANIEDFASRALPRLREMGLIQAIKSEVEVEHNLNYVVHPLVKRYVRGIIDQTENHLEMQQFGLHGLLSRGPYQNPGKSDKPLVLFRHFATLAFKEVECVVRGDEQCENSSRELLAHGKVATYYIRALIDILRSNFACNSVPLWGKFRDYIDMLSMTIDLLRNLARAKGPSHFWRPGELREAQPEEWTDDDGVASAEEMLHLYNELGLAYYNMGAVQDALSVWSLAFDWQKVLRGVSSIQAQMYAATLDAHIGMAYMQLGRMPTAKESFEKARKAAKEHLNKDLELRMVGMLARLEHFHGNIPEARTTYIRVINQLKTQGNLRAQSYFMRHLAALESRMGDCKEARRLARESKAIAASVNAADLVAFASELEGRVLSSSGEYSNAIGEYRVALNVAREFDISRLEADILLGMAKIQLRFGDASAARRRAIDALKLANENLLVQRQVKALLILGKVSADFGDNVLAKATLMHAKSLARESHFRLLELEAEEAVAELQVRGLGRAELQF